jgi:hypothetical protein
MTILRHKRRLSPAQAFAVLNPDFVYNNCKPLWDTARKSPTYKKPYVAYAQKFCEDIMKASVAPASVPDWASRVSAAKFLAEHGYPRGGDPPTVPVLSNLEMERYLSFILRLASQLITN